MENQMMIEMQTQNVKNFGFSPDDYQAFLTSYGELSYATAHNDFSYVSLMDGARKTLGKKNFSKFLKEGLRLSESEISDLNRKLSAYQMIPSQTIWNTIGYRGIQRIISLSQDLRGKLLRDIAEQGENLTLKQFFSLYNRYTKRDSSWNGSQKGRKDQDQKGRKGDDRITLNRSDLERIVRLSIESTLGVRSSKPRGNKPKNKGKTLRSDRFAVQPMMA